VRLYGNEGCFAKKLKLNLVKSLPILNFESKHLIDEKNKAGYKNKLVFAKHPSNLIAIHYSASRLFKTMKS
jgi:hypothetical protein